MSPVMFRNWFFERLIWILVSGEWVIKIKDFKNSKKRKERELFGLAVPSLDGDGGIIYLDMKRGTPRILIHELGHVVLGDILDLEATDKNKTTKKIDEWTEDQVLLFEELFYKCLSAKQRQILKTFIDMAKIDSRYIP
jgi:hypothetical protein